MIYDIDNSKTALLIIDAQREYSDPGRPLYTEGFPAAVEQINKISTACRKSGIPVFVIKHVHDETGKDVGRMGDFSNDEVFTRGSAYTDLDKTIFTESSDIVVEKTRYSSFVHTKLEAYLRSMQIDTVIITGFMSGYCCVTTARHAHDLDYRVIYADDATSGPVFGDLGFGSVSLEEIKRVVATLLSGGVAEVILSEEVVKRIK